MQKILGWGMSVVLTLLFVGSASGKLMGNPEMANMLGGKENLLILGITEIVMVILFLIPRTGIVGTLLMIAYMGGAMAVHFTNGQAVILQMVIQIFIWITAAIRFPELTGRLFPLSNA